MKYIKIYEILEDGIETENKFYWSLPKDEYYFFAGLKKIGCPEKRIKEMWEKVQHERHEAYQKISELKAEIGRYEHLKETAKDIMFDELDHKDKIIALKDAEIKRLYDIIVFSKKG